MAPSHHLCPYIVCTSLESPGNTCENCVNMFVFLHYHMLAPSGDGLMFNLGKLDQIKKKDFFLKINLLQTNALC